MRSRTEGVSSTDGKNEASVARKESSHEHVAWHGEPQVRLTTTTKPAVIQDVFHIAIAYL
eukprot:2240527-Rhodomonas_salina.1